jgi:hypothetical protein
MGPRIILKQATGFWSFKADGSGCRRGSGDDDEIKSPRITGGRHHG